MLFTRFYSRIQSGSIRTATSLILLAMLLGVTFIGFLPLLGQYVSADSSVVQNQVSGSACSLGSSCEVNLDFPSSVISGNVVVVAAFDQDSTSLTIADSLSSSYSAMASTTDSSGYVIYIFAATLTSSGKDTVTLTDSSGNSIGIYAEFLEIAGVTTALSQTAQGSDLCPSFPCNTSALTSDSFAPGAFLLSETVVHFAGATFLSGSGFTAETILSSEGYSQYATTGVSSPTYFPATLSSSTSSFGRWAEVAVSSPTDINDYYDHGSN